jgi:putative membrane protein
MNSVTAVLLSADPDRWHGPHWWPVFPLLWLLIIIGVITTCVLVARRNRDRTAVRSGESRLAERFAAGEIAEDEYRHRLGILKEKR